MPLWRTQNPAATARPLDFAHPSGIISVEKDRVGPGIRPPIKAPHPRGFLQSLRFVTNLTSTGRLADTRYDTHGRNRKRDDDLETIDLGICIDTPDFGDGLLPACSGRVLLPVRGSQIMLS